MAGDTGDRGGRRGASRRVRGVLFGTRATAADQRSGSRSGGDDPAAGPPRPDARARPVARDPAGRPRADHRATAGARRRRRTRRGVARGSRVGSPWRLGDRLGRGRRRGGGDLGRRHNDHRRRTPRRAGRRSGPGYARPRRGGQRHGPGDGRVRTCDAWHSTGPTDAGVAGTLLYSPSSTDLVVVATGLVEPPEGMQYGCWVDTGSGRERVGRMFFGGGLAYWVGPSPAVAGSTGSVTFGVSLVDASGAISGPDPVLVGGS